MIDKKPEDKEVKNRYTALFEGESVCFEPIGLKGFLEKWNEFF